MTAGYHEEARATGITHPVLGSVLLNDSIYIISDTAVWSLPTQTLDENHPQLTAVATSPLVSKSSIAIGADTGILILDGTSFSIHQLNAVSHQWSIPQANNSTTKPSARSDYTAVVNNSNMFVYGGTNNNTCVTDPLWLLDIDQQQWKPLQADNGRYGHTASMLSDGRMVVLGGRACNGDLTDLSSALIYNTRDGRWHSQMLSGDIPAPRTLHTAVTTVHDRIVICGGQNEVAPPFHTYISSNGHLDDMAALLDTSNWEWKRVHASLHDQPLPQSKAMGLLVNRTKFVYGLGQSYQTIHDGLYMLDTESLQWVSRTTDSSWLHDGQPTSPSVAMLSVTAIVALCFGFLTLIGVLWLVWSLGRQAILQGISSLKHELWDPRPGEPGWTEVTRLTMRFTFTCYMIYLLLSLTKQIMHSPIIDQQYYENDNDGAIDVPDVRFCFDDKWQQEPYVRCSTDYGTQCSQYLQTFHPPTARERVCILFRAPSSMRLAPPIHRQAAGSYLKFDYYGNATQVEIALYHRNHDPNIVVYNLEPTDTFTWTSPYEEGSFRASESSAYHRYEQEHLLMANRVHTGSYSLAKRIVLDKDAWWNYIGYASDTATWYQVMQSKITSESSAPTYLGNEEPLGSLHLFPERYATQIIAEQRAFTVVQALGVLGGMFGLLVTAQHWLFGYRPRSPWGVIQRWSIGQMRLSLLQGLVRKFQQQHENVPIVHPLKKSSATAERMARLEDRLHTLEQLFQAYYIDDEIFQSLDQAFTRPAPPMKPEPSDSLLRLRLPSFKKKAESL
ncbi:hypothetical protein BJV82DRAFT_708020 [Fennellomyces sp. T-0311]|nr:hypothetical protein BJV82DRAFT_708020 [Fennellomyces sp. T-0311]